MLLVCIACLVVSGVAGQAIDHQVQEYLRQYNERAETLYNKYMLASWEYESNITNYNQEKMTEVSLEFSEFTKNESVMASQYNISQLTDDSLKRQMEMILDVGISGYEDGDALRKISELGASMSSMYSSAKWCINDTECKALEPDLTDIMTNSRDYEELKAAWKGWRDVSGAKMRDQYEEYVGLLNKAIRANGKYQDMGEYYRSWYEQPTFESDVRDLFDQLAPMYDNLHAYVRRKLRDHYGAEHFPSSGHIPAHLFGNMWAQQWGNIYDLLEPFPGQGRESLTEEMKRQNYTIRQMYEVAEEFFTSIGMKPMPDSFWEKSILEKPTDGRNMVCHASAWDFANGTDFRIKQCTTVTEDQLITVHHEMGHVQYFLEYMHQPYLYRDGANPGFHEGVADIVSLSFQTPEHLLKINLTDSLPSTQEGDINFLFKMALNSVAFLPFGYLIDQWRWSVFREETTPSTYNRDWWKLRCQYQGISPPVQRSEADFDPGAKYHIPANVPYIRYFVSFVAQFQWHKALCELIGQQEPLHRCDIYQNETAGARLREMLQMGSSRPWGEAMQRITRGTSGETDKLDAQAILDYFRPLVDWLQSNNTASGETIGWDKTNCPIDSFEAMTLDQQVQQYLEDYNIRVEALSYKYSLAAWDYNTNITDYNQKKMTELSLQFSEFTKNESVMASQYNISQLTDDSLKRQMEMILDVGISGYEDTDALRQISELGANLSSTYSSAKLCANETNCKSLEPDLTDIMTNSRDYEELKNAWKGWRDVSGAKMRDQYEAYVGLLNKAIKAGGKYEDMGEYYRSWYEQPTFEGDVRDLFDQLAPMYDNLHAYVRRKLREYYGAEHFPSSGHIPAHIFGNMWAQQWGNIYDILEPFPGQGRESLTEEMKRQNYTIRQMYEVAEEFFTSIGMKPMPDSFWENSMLEKPTDGRDVVCHASAWDFSNGTDFRIKQCTTVTEDQLITVHHEMGHVQYFLEYIHQPYLYRAGANPGFHEGVADIVSLSFQTPEHLLKINLTDSLPSTNEGDINFLFKMALNSVAFLPFGYLIDQWRWSVFRGETTPSTYNRDWWNLRCQYQGISPPVQRSEADFDPGAKYHIPANVPYIRYFVSFVAQFQWHKALCELIGQQEPLHRCDIYQNETAGARLQEMLQMGSSRPWGEAMQRITRGTSGETDKLDAQAILDYFRPLVDWLQSNNTESGETIGWDKTNCPIDSFETMTLDQQVQQYLEDYNNRVEALSYKYSLAAWDYNTNITDYNQKKMTELSLQFSEFTKNESVTASKFNISQLTDDSLKRQMEMILDVGISGYEDTDALRQISELGANLSSTYSSAKLCANETNCKSLEPDLTDIMTNSRDYEELKNAWKGWRDVSGAKMRDQYEAYVGLLNKAIKAGGKYEDMGEYYRSWYEQPTFEGDVRDLFDQLAPMYDNLHAYVRRKLREYYGAEHFPSSGHIPAHIFGNMWAQQWGNIYDILEPFPGQGRESLTEEMKRQNYTIRQMYEVAEEFFTSIGMKPMPDSFWENSMLEKPTDGRDVVCHASAWDFSNGTDFRIKQCTTVTEDQLITVHHEMGHIQYYLEYINQPYLYRAGANPGFHEGVADIVSLSFQTPEHLLKINLTDSLPSTNEGDINFLFKMALNSVAFLPFGYLIDQWRWSVFRGETTPSTYNRDWWKLRCQYQGISPPVRRSEADFDPGAKYHIPANVPYIRYFVSFVAQFQWHKALCELIGQQEPLHRCDIYQNETAGARLQEMLQMGSSRPWGEAMQRITRGTSGETDKLDAQAILDYFKPLVDWLQSANAANDETVGWDKTNCPIDSFEGTTMDQQVQQYLEDYNNRVEALSYNYSLATWDYNTNITDYNQKKMTELSLQFSEFTKNESVMASKFNMSQLTNDSLKRQMEMILDVGISGYEDGDALRKISELGANLSSTYSSAKWCANETNCKSLEPDLTYIMTNSRDYDELKAAWKGWRDVSGAKMRDQYEEYVRLLNKAIKAGGKYEDMGEYYRSWYEQPTFEGDVRDLFDQLAPMYDNLHAYVRRKLREYYGAEHFPSSGHIPAHIFGNMWAQQWGNIYDILEPFPGQGRESLTEEMKRQNYTIRQMYEVAEEFFTSIGMKPMPDSFWENSMLEKPTDGREVVCHASAWDFSNGTDFRIKQCTTVTEDQLITVHHEMGHIQYYLEYIHQPYLYRSGANPGFHEGVADIVSLSFQTPEHLLKINLTDSLPSTNEGDINFLFKMALNSVAFLPFGYLIDQWRWSVFRGETTPSTYNRDWWNLSCQYQGISPPVQRSEADFDPGAKYHIPANVPYIRYFVSFVAQFQWHKALCELIGQQEPLHRCDIYQNETAGARLQEMLQMGSSRPWGEAMQRITRGTSGETDKLDAQAILDYFKPLVDWLQSANAANDETVGWDKTNCPIDSFEGTTMDQQVQQYLEDYNNRVEALSYKYSLAAWDYNTNITDYNQEKMTELSLQFSEFTKNESVMASKFNISQLTNDSLKRQMEMILDVGISGYEDGGALRKISELGANLSSTYSSAKWCANETNCKSLEPDLTYIMTNSRNYDELKAAWKGWRDVSGAKMRDQYEEYVRLLNKAIKAGGKYEDMGEYYRSWYEQPTFESDVRDLFDQLAPMYDNLHAYVRRKLREYYGAEHFSSSGHIPAHIFGNMWAQQWGNIYDILEPFPGQGRESLTDEMERQNYTIRQMYEVAEEFFTSIGMKPMPDSFWENSMLEKPTDGREVVCHASAWDFSNGTDFRIKQCTTVTEDQLITVHHEMGHIQYYLEYINQPYLYRSGANPGFHEGVADIVSLSFQTPEHLLKINLTDSLPSTNEGDINFLFKMALNSVAFLPFGYLIDQWRWSVFRGETTPSTYNRDWWNLRCRYQGVSPPVQRSELDFDPGAKFHIPANVPYIRYFVSFVAQFQWHKALCELIGQQEPLHRCDIYRNKTAGVRLQEMLQMGSSRPWGEAMQRITRGTSGETDKLDAQAILDYFKPLVDWLQTQNIKNDETVGWDKSNCPSGSFDSDVSHADHAVFSTMTLIVSVVLHILLT